MLETVLNYLNNYFIMETIDGAFDIVDSTLIISKALDGQYIRIQGSALNDGIYQYPVADLKDEAFTGEIQLLGIPKHLLEIVNEIKEYNEKYPATPYNSESFGGYSYTRANSSSNDRSKGSWQQVYKSDLNRYRKII